MMGHEVRLSFLDDQGVILSVGQIAGYMLQRRRFAEVDIDIFDDGALFGEAFCLDEVCDGSRLK